jgi:antagonist of KipI
MSWRVSKHELEKIYFPSHEVRCVESTETQFLSDESRETLFGSLFKVSPQSNRMGFRLKGGRLTLRSPLELVSSAVDFGTVQLLPDGQLIVLMADHQTTGGYPRIASVIRADLSKLSQVNAHEEIRFKLISLHDAEHAWLQREELLAELKLSCLSNIKKTIS